MIKVELTPWEYKAAVDLANARMAISNDRKLNHASTYQRTYAQRVNEEVVGACGEMAFSKATGCFFSPTVNTFHNQADIGQTTEIRSTALPHGSLIIRDNDPDDRWYVLVTGEPPTMNIIGCIKGRDAKQNQWLRDPHGHRPAWFVPQDALRPATSKTETKSQ